MTSFGKRRIQWARFLLLPAILLLIPPSAFAAPITPLDGAISGVVTGTGGARLSGVAVSLYNASESFVASATTNASGMYTVAGLQSGTYFAITFNNVGYVDQLYGGMPWVGPVTTGTPIIVALGTITPNIDFPLVQTGRISGTITGTGGALLAGVTVFVSGSSGGFVTSAITNASGLYMTAGIPPGSYVVLTGSGSGYFNQLYNGISCGGSCVVTTGTPIAVAPGATTSNINFQLVQEGRISGKVWGPGGALLSGVTVQVYNASGNAVTSVSTDASGVYTITGLSAGSYFARTFNSLGYTDRLYSGISCGPCTVTAGTPIAVYLGSITSNINFLIFDIPPVGSKYDFNGDGKADILWRDTGGVVWMWLLNGYSIINDTIDYLVPDRGNVIANIWTGWSSVGTGDFNGDGKADILWRDIDGNVAIWFMDGITISGFTRMGSMPKSWIVAGVVDFDADGKADILWRDIDGKVAIWLMNGTSIASGSTIASIWTGWTIAGAGDFNGDGMADILWRDTSGAVAIWLMNGTKVTSYATIASMGTGWSIVNTGDFNGDGKADILWRDDSGAVAIWLMNGMNVNSSSTIANIWPGWTIVGVRDFDGDGMADILWRDPAGNVAIWLMNGTTVSSFRSMGNEKYKMVQ